MTRRAFALITAVLALLCAAPMAVAQAKPEQTLRLVLKGYDPVAYFVDGRPTPGNPEFETVFDEARYRFVSAENMRLFKADPDKYAPRFNGACAGGLSMGMKIEANPRIWRIVDGKLYVFASPKVLVEMDRDPHRLIAKANENWKTLKHEPF